MRITGKVLVTVFSYGVTTVVGFLGTLYFTNVLGAALFGKYVLGMTLVKWLIVGDFGFRKATQKRISEGVEVGGIYATSLVVHLSSASVLVLGVLAARPWINGYVGGDYALLVIGLFVSMLSFELLGMALIGIKRVHVWKGLNALSQVGRVAAQFGLVVFGLKVAGLFLGHIAAFVVAAAIAAILLWFRYGMELNHPRKQHFQSLFEYAKFSWLERFRSQTFAWMDILIMGFFLTSSIVGTYQVAWTISMTFGILAAAISETMFPELSELATEDRESRISDLLSEGFVYAAFIPIPGLFGALILGRDVLALFGQEFTQGYTLLVVLAALSIVLSFDNQLRTAIDSLDYPHYTFRVNILFIISNLVMNMVFIYYLGAVGAALASLLSLLASATYSLYLLRNLLYINFPISDIALQFLAASGMLAVVAVIKPVFPVVGAVRTFLMAGLGAAVYFVLITTASTEIRNKIISIVGEGVIPTR